MSDVSVRDAARQALEGITPGQWRAISARDGCATIASVTVGNGGEGWKPVVYATGQPCDGARIDNPADAEFIAAAPELVRGLLAELDRVEGQATLDVNAATHGTELLRGQAIQWRNERDVALSTLQKVREGHQTVDVCGSPRHTNPEVACPECMAVCESCGQDMPCNTIRILDGGDQQ